MHEEQAKNILGIVGQSTRSLCRKHYHRLLREHPPETDPEGFKQLRQAYEVLTQGRSRFSSAAPPVPPEFPPRRDADDQSSTHAGQETSEPNAPELTLHQLGPDLDELVAQTLQAWALGDVLGARQSFVELEHVRAGGAAAGLRIPESARIMFAVAEELQSLSDEFPVGLAGAMARGTIGTTSHKAAMAEVRRLKRSESTSALAAGEELKARTDLLWREYGSAFAGGSASTIQPLCQQLLSILASLTALGLVLPLLWFLLSLSSGGLSGRFNAPPRELTPQEFCASLIPQGTQVCRNMLRALAAGDCDRVFELNYALNRHFARNAKPEWIQLTRFRNHLGVTCPQLREPR